MKQEIVVFIKGETETQLQDLIDEGNYIQCVYNDKENNQLIVVVNKTVTLKQGLSTLRNKRSR